MYTAILTIRFRTMAALTLFCLYEGRNAPWWHAKTKWAWEGVWCLAWQAETCSWLIVDRIVGSLLIVRRDISGANVRQKHRKERSPTRCRSCTKLLKMRNFSLYLSRDLRSTGKVPLIRNISQTSCLMRGPSSQAIWLCSFTCSVKCVSLICKCAGHRQVVGILPGP